MDLATYITTKQQFAAEIARPRWKWTADQCFACGNTTNLPAVKAIVCGRVYCSECLRREENIAAGRYYAENGCNGHGEPRSELAYHAPGCTFPNRKDPVA